MCCLLLSSDISIQSVQEDLTPCLYLKTVEENEWGFTRLSRAPYCLIQNLILHSTNLMPFSFNPVCHSLSVLVSNDPDGIQIKIDNLFDLAIKNWECVMTLINSFYCAAYSMHNNLKFDLTNPLRFSFSSGVSLVIYNGQEHVQPVLSNEFLIRSFTIFLLP